MSDDLIEAAAEIERLRAARDAVLEEAAKVADECAADNKQDRWSQAVCEKVADRIRALKENT